MDQFKNQEVFVVTGSETEELSDLFVTDQRGMLDEYLLLKDPTVDEDIRVFHGVLTLAEFLPSSFQGKSAFLVVTAPDKMDKGCVVEAGETPNEVAKEVEAIIDSANPITFGEITIDNIYILYGYQVGLGFAVREDDLDEECIFACEAISDETEEVEDALAERNQQGEQWYD